MADLNVIWRQVTLSADDLDSQEIDCEEHNSRECEFVPRKLPWNILGTRKIVYVLVRKCVCGREEDKSDLAQTHVIYISEFGDGVELHLTDRCHYRLTEHHEDVIV